MSRIEYGSKQWKATASDLWDRVKERTEAKGLTLNGLSVATTGGRVTINNWKARRRMPDPVSLYRIADELGVSMEWLVTGQERRGVAVPPELEGLVADLRGLSKEQVDTVAVQVAALAKSNRKRG